MAEIHLKFYQIAVIQAVSAIMFSVQSFNTKELDKLRLPGLLTSMVRQFYAFLDISFDSVFAISALDWCFCTLRRGHHYHYDHYS